jgi:predicted DNA-binding transcriptional regulator AlpA
MSLKQYECEHCRKAVEFLSIEEAMAVANCSRRTIYNWLKTEKLHRIITISGRTLICKSSLFRPIENSTVTYFN